MERVRLITRRKYVLQKVMLNDNGNGDFVLDIQLKTSQIGTSSTANSTLYFVSVYSAIIELSLDLTKNIRKIQKLNFGS